MPRTPLRPLVHHLLYKRDRLGLLKKNKRVMTTRKLQQAE